MNEPYHHGVKGQKCRVRRYQNKDGTLTNMGKARRTMNDVNDIVNTMSKKDKELMNLSGETYQSTIEEEQRIIKRFVKYVGDTPVSFFDITGDKTGVALTIGTRAGEEYRGNTVKPSLNAERNG